MKHSTLTSLSHRVLRLAALSLMFATPLTFGGEPVTSDHGDQLIGHIVVSASRLAPANVVFADLGGMTVTARRDTALARNETAHVAPAAL
jgi:hypothetical protein